MLGIPNNYTIGMWERSTRTAEGFAILVYRNYIMFTFLLLCSGYPATVEGRKKGRTLRRVGIFTVGHPCAAPFQRWNRGQKQPFRRSGSGLTAKFGFHLFHCSWAKIPNAFAYLPFFLDQPYLVFLLLMRGQFEAVSWKIPEEPF